MTDAAAPTIAPLAARRSPPAVRPLKLGSREVWPPVVPTPMAGITNMAFRRLCREQGGGRLRMVGEDDLADHVDLNFGCRS
jgi:tRNA-dihydrouridine synthase